MRPVETLAEAVSRVRALHTGAPDEARQTNLLVAVLDCSLPRPTRGTDFNVRMRVMDASSSEELGMRDGVELMVFSRDMGALPQANAHADIIRLQDVVVSSWNGRPQLLGQLNPKRPFSYFMFSGALGAPDVPYRFGGARAAAGWQVGPDDVAKLSALRHLAAHMGLTGSDEGRADHCLRKVMDLKLPPIDAAATALYQQQQQQQQTLQQRPQQLVHVHGPGEVLDMRCQVLAIDRSNPLDPVMFVWDSTDAPPMPSRAVIRPAVFRCQEFRAAQRHRVMPLLPGEAGVEMLADLPPLGTALPVVVPQPHGSPPIALPAVGEWVKLKMVGLQLHEGQLMLVAGSCSRISLVAKDPHFDAAWAQRRASNDTAVFAARPVTCCPQHQGLPLVTVRQVLQRRLEGVSGTFRLLVRVTGHVPEDPATFCRRCNQGVTWAGAPWVYAAKLRLEDATGALDALLIGRHAQALLGPPPCDLGSSPEQLARITQVLALLRREPPSAKGVDGEGFAWAEVVISSGYSSAAADAAAAAASAAAANAGVGAAVAGSRGPVRAGSAAALAGRSGCVFILHDTVLA